MRGHVGAVRAARPFLSAMRDVLQVFFEIILAIAGAVFFGSATVAVVALAVGCVAFGGCWSFLGWRRRRATRLRERE